MKFSDMMHKRDRNGSEVTEPEAPPEANTAPPVPDAPIRFGAHRSEIDDAGHGGSVVPTVEPPVAAAPPPPVLAPPPPPRAVAPSPQAVTPPPPPPVVAPPPPAPAVTPNRTASVVSEPGMVDALAPAAPVPSPRPSIHDVVAELAPRSAVAATSSAVTDQQLDASAWLDGIGSIDDDLLPR